MNDSKSQQHASIFLNYRREDSKDSTTRLHDDLEYAIGNEKVFIDLSSITPGRSWPQLIRDKLNAAAVVIVVIGRDWLKVQDPESYQRRLDADGDWVRVEIEDAFRQEKVVIPVLVRDAVLPMAAQLPPSIRELAHRQAITITAEDWHRDIGRLIEALAIHGIRPIRDVPNSTVRPEPSMLGVIDYFYRRISQAASGSQTRDRPAPHIVNCAGMSDLWQFVEDLMLQKQPIDEAPAIHIQGQLSPYAPLLFGNPMHKRQLHLELRQSAVQLIEELGYEFGDILNGLLSYSAGQMVIMPYFRSNYVFLGLYESIVRNSIPIMIERQYYNATLGSLFRQFNTLDVRLQAFLGKIPNYTKDALDDFGITERLRSILGEQTIQQIGKPNCALFVQGDDDTFIDLPDMSGKPLSSRYLDGDVWVANAENSLITRFINISSREEMLNAVAQINHELRKSAHGRGTVSSFDVRLAPIEDTMPDRILSTDQLEQHTIR